jgi:hypothetical protein
MNLVVEPRPGVLSREEHLLRLARFCALLRQRLAESGIRESVWRQAILDSAGAECTGCGQHVSGDELLDLAEPPRARDEKHKLRRLRLGDCARQGCSAYVYRLDFSAHPVLDWAQLVARVQEDLEPAGRRPRRRRARGIAAALWLPTPRTALRAAASMALLAVVLLGHQYYVGGRIFLIREPEEFQVDAWPAEETTPEGTALDSSGPETAAEQ